VSSEHDWSVMTVSAHVGEDGRVTCHTYKLTTPILVITTGPASVCLSVKGGREDMPAQAVAFARDLAACAQQFADECQRLHGLHRRATRPDSAQAPPGMAAAGTP